MFPVLYSSNEPEHFLGFFTSWIRIREAYLYADPCESGSETLVSSLQSALRVVDFICDKPGASG